MYNSVTTEVVTKNPIIYCTAELADTNNKDMPNTEEPIILSKAEEIKLKKLKRKQELNRHLILFLKVAEKIKNKNIETQFILGLAPELDLSAFSIPNWINRYMIELTALKTM